MRKTVIVIATMLCINNLAWSQDVTENNIDTSYNYFKSLDDDEMADFLKTNDNESYEIFHRGEIQKRTGINLFIYGGAVTGAGVFILAGCGLIYAFDFIFLIGSLGATISFHYWWVRNAHWFAKAGLSMMIIGQPFLITGIALWANGSNLKRQAKNNYENKFFKRYTSSLHINFYPNGLGVTLNF